MCSEAFESNLTNFIACLFILKRAIRFKDKWYSVGTSGGVAGGANLRTFAYLSVFSSLLVIMRRNTGLLRWPGRSRVRAAV